MVVGLVNQMEVYAVNLPQGQKKQKLKAWSHLHLRLVEYLDPSSLLWKGAILMVDILQNTQNHTDIMNTDHLLTGIQGITQTEIETGTTDILPHVGTDHAHVLHCGTCTTHPDMMMTLPEEQDLMIRINQVNEGVQGWRVQPEVPREELHYPI